MALSAYELQRLANIAENKRKLAELNLGDAQTKKVKKSHAGLNAVAVAAAVVEKRSCPRLRGVQSDGRQVPRYPPAARWRRGD